MGDKKASNLCAHGQAHQKSSETDHNHEIAGAVPLAEDVWEHVHDGGVDRVDVGQLQKEIATEKKLVNQSSLTTCMKSYS